MGTLSKSLTENLAYKKSTWTFTASCNDVAVTGDTFSVPLPTVNAKYVYSGKNVAYVTDFRIYPVVGSSSYSSNWSNFTYGGGDLASNPWASNASKTLSRTGGGTILSDRTTSAFFKASNKTTRTITLTYKCTTVSAESAIKSSDGYIYEANLGQLRVYSSDTGMPFDIATANITLNAPPTVMYDTPVYSTPHYAGLGAYSVTVTSAEAQYGGDIQTITLTVGSDSVTQNYSTATVTNQTLSVTPSVAGTFTPTLEVTDSRGQVTTINFEQITVNAYTAPNISFDLQRTNGSGIPNAEGEHALVTASISYTDAIAELTQPTVAVRDGDGNLVVSSATWYETWDATNGVSDAVNWTDYNPQSPATLYAVVSSTGASLSPNESYTVSITPTDNQGGVAQTITQTLSTGFFTIDFKAGGKEIAFGAPANDTLTQKQEQIGLFKCAMDTNFNDMSQQEVADFIDGLNVGGGGQVVTVDEQSKLESSATGTMTFINCSGTISHNQIFFVKLASGIWFIHGRLNINSFTRSGSNPGVTIALPDIVPTPTVSKEYLCGFRSQATRESVVLGLTANSRNAKLYTYESFSNASNGTLTFIVNSIFTLD